MMTGRERELFQALIEIVIELGWTAAFPEDQLSENPDDIRGMIIGDQEYLEYVLNNIPEGGAIVQENLQ